MPRSKRRSTRNGGRESSAQSDDSEDVPLAKKFTNSKNQNNDSSEEDVPLAKKFSGPKRKKGRPRKIKSESEEDEDDKECPGLACEVCGATGEEACAASCWSCRSGF